MLEIRKTAVSFDKKEAFLFLEKSIYDRISYAQQGRLKSHLDEANPTEAFEKSNKI